MTQRLRDGCSITPLFRPRRGAGFRARTFKGGQRLRLFVTPRAKASGSALIDLSPSYLPSPNRLEPRVGHGSVAHARTGY